MSLKYLCSVTDVCRFNPNNMIMTRDNDADLEWAIGINRVSLKIIGLWPDNKLNHRQRFLANLRAFVIFITMILASIVPGVLALIKVWGNMMAMTDNLQIGLPFSVTAMKFIIMWFRKEGNFVWTVYCFYSVYHLTMLLRIIKLTCKPVIFLQRTYAHHRHDRRRLD